MKVMGIKSKGFSIYEGNLKVYESVYSLRKVRQLLKTVRGYGYRRALFLLSDLCKVDKKLVEALLDLEISFERFLGLSMTSSGKRIFDGVDDYLIDVVVVLLEDDNEV